MLSLRQTEKSRRSQMRRPFPTKELGEPTSAWRDSPRWTIRTRPHILSSFDCLRIRSRHCREDSLARREVRGRWNNIRFLLARFHLHVKRQRDDYQKELLADLYRKNDVLVLEKLNVRNMLKNHSLSKSISEASSYGQFIS